MSARKGPRQLSVITLFHGLVRPLFDGLSGGWADHAPTRSSMPSCSRSSRTLRAADAVARSRATGLAPQPSPHVSYDRESLSQGSVLGDVFAEPLDERPQADLRHVRDQLVEHTALPEQRMGPVFGRVGLEMAIHAEAFASGAEQRPAGSETGSGFGLTEIGWFARCSPMLSEAVASSTAIAFSPASVSLSA